MSLLLIGSLSKDNPLSVFTKPSKSATLFTLPSNGVLRVLLPVALVAILLRYAVYNQ